MSSNENYKFEGWVGVDKSAVDGKMVWQSYNPKSWEETDIDIEITHCGICGSDLHTLRSGWGETNYPCVVGHEIVGKAVCVGSKVNGIKVNDRVGVGAQCDSCLGRKEDCEDCESGLENHCSYITPTYDGKFLNGDKSYGGYAKYHRSPSHFVFKIPDALPSSAAAPMLCGGVTTYSPLKNNGCGPGKRVGIVGVGGLGHFGILWAKALDADHVVGISRRGDKREDALKLGADAYIATEEDKDWETKYAHSLDLIVCTVSSTKLPLSKYLQLLRTKGRYVQVGVPEGPLPAVHAFELIMKGVTIGGSSIGSPNEIREMLQLAADRNVRPWIEERPMKEANTAVVDMKDGKARYRYVLFN
ncbi:hypothetical protein FRC19_003960 [Serendipita sp. 401]|nr:hypothetical protein FRC19_003960 [Serendipita sp. 401]KAG8834327.1 hypothetical protein FRC18_002196 [Serendipita sp. 400]